MSKYISFSQTDTPEPRADAVFRYIHVDQPDMRRPKRSAYFKVPGGTPPVCRVPVPDLPGEVVGCEQHTMKTKYNPPGKWHWVEEADDEQ